MHCYNLRSCARARCVVAAKPRNSSSHRRHLRVKQPQQPDKYAQHVAKLAHMLETCKCTDNHRAVLQAMLDMWKRLGYPVRT